MYIYICYVHSGIWEHTGMNINPYKTLFQILTLTAGGYRGGGF